MTSEADAVTIGQFLAVLRRRWRAVLTCVVLALALSAAYVMVTPPQFTSRAVVKVDALGDDPLRSGDDTDVNTVTESKVVTSSSVAERASEAIAGDEEAAELLDRVEVSSPVGSQVLEIRFTAETAEGAAEGANAFATSYLDYRRATVESRLQARIKNLEAQKALQQQISRETAALSDPEDGPARVAELAAARASSARQVEVLDGQIAQLRGAQVFPGEVVDRGQPPPGDGRLPLAVALSGGLLLGLLLGTAAALWRQSADDHVSSVSDLTRASDLPVLASLALSRSARHDEPWEVVREEKEGLRLLAGKLLSHPETSARSFLLVAAEPGGSRQVPAGVAAALAGQGLRVMFVRCTPEVVGPDVLRRPDDERWLLEGRRWAELADGALHVLDLGPEDRLDRKVVRDMSDRLLQVGDHDAVVIDGVNVQSRSTVLTLASLAKHSVIVAERRQATQSQVRALQADLAQVGIAPFGGVLVDAVDERRRVVALHSSPIQDRPDVRPEPFLRPAQDEQLEAGTRGAAQPAYLQARDR